MSNNYYSPGGMMAAAGLRPGRRGMGQAEAQPVPAQTAALATRAPVQTVWSVAGTAASMALAYHGYRRTKSVGWAIAWAIGGGIFWPIALPIAFAQGFGKPMSGVRENPSRRRRRRRRS